MDCQQCAGTDRIVHECNNETILERCPSCRGHGKHGVISASEILVGAADAIDNRASQRDHENGERSMARTVAAFNALTGHQLSELDGWVLLAILKFARGQGGKPVLDDYVDAAAYAALAGECAMGGPHG